MHDIPERIYLIFVAAALMTLPLSGCDTQGVRAIDKVLASSSTADSLTVTAPVKVAYSAAVQSKDSLCALSHLGFTDTTQTRHLSLPNNGVLQVTVRPFPDDVVTAQTSIDQIKEPGYSSFLAHADGQVELLHERCSLASGPPSTP